MTLPVKFRQEIAAIISSELKLDLPAKLHFKIIYDDDRRIYKIAVEGTEQFFVLKIRGIKVVKQQDHDIQDLKKEYQLLESAWASAKDMQPGYSMSQPIKLWVEQKAMLLSGCSGENFNDFFNAHLIKWMFNSNELSGGINQCGRWLGNYHQLASSETSLNNHFENRNNNLVRMTKFLRNNTQHSLSNSQLDEIEKRFESLTSKNASGPVGLVHGNFAYRNILFSADQINLVDFEDAHVEHVAFDIGQFAAELSFKSQFPWLRHQTKRLLQQFLDGYETAFPLQKEITQAYIGYHLVVHLYEHCSRKKLKGMAKYILNYRIAYLAKLIKNWLK